MSVTIKDVDYVAKLARLSFSEAEKERFTHEFNNILGFVEKLSEVDTEGVEPSISSYPLYNALREDEEIPSMNRELIKQNAPEEKFGFVKVPKVIE